MNDKIIAVVITLCLLGGIYAVMVYDYSLPLTPEIEEEYVFFMRIITTKELVDNKYKGVKE